MAVKGFLYLYILLVGSVSILSYKKGIYLIWITFLFIPTIILEQKIKLGLPLETILMLGSVVSELRFKRRRELYRDFLNHNQKAIITYFFVSFTIVFFSQTVPRGTQIRALLTEIAMLLFSLQTFMLVKNEDKTAKIIMRIICCAIVFNVAFCLFFEVFIGINPAGMPLYIALGIDDNQFITDMIDYERGGMSFRAQTVYRHPLSLGQYMLVLLPLFLMEGKQLLKYVYILFICSLIILSGSRSAMAPMILILILSELKKYKAHFRKFVLLIFVIVVAISFMPDKDWKKINRQIEPFVASLAFWDDKKQYANEIDGSSMEMRFNQFDAALKEITDNPIFGRGYNYRDYYIFKHNALHPDLLGFESVLLLHLVERGWLGLLFFFVMAIYIYNIFSREALKKKTFKLIFLGYILSIIMTGVRPLTILFVCLACSIVYSISDKQERKLIGNTEIA